MVGLLFGWMSGVVLLFSFNSGVIAELKYRVKYEKLVALVQQRYYVALFDAWCARGDVKPRDKYVRNGGPILVMWRGHDLQK